MKSLVVSVALAVSVAGITSWTPGAIGGAVLLGAGVIVVAVVAILTLASALIGPRAPSAGNMLR